MGKFETKNLTEASQLFMLMKVSAEIFPLLKDANLTPSQGVIYFCESGKAMERVLHELQKMGAVLCKQKKQFPDAENCLNFKHYLHPMQPKDDREIIMDFLELGEALTAVITCGLLPEYLDIGEHVFIIEDAQTVGFPTEDAYEAVKEFADFVHKHPGWLVDELNQFKTSKLYQQLEERASLWTLICAAATCFLAFYRRSHSEEEYDLARKQINATVQYFRQLQLENENLDDLCAMVRKAVEGFIDNDERIEIGCAAEVSEEMQEALEENRCILFNRDFYYIPEELLRTACSERLQNVSMLKIKAELYAEGVIQINDSVTKTYTVKKQFLNSHGKQMRMRFLKFRRNFFETVDSLSLEERRKIHENRKMEGA